MTKIRQDNDVIDLMSATYAKNETELSWLIQKSENYDENETEQWHDRLYRCGLCRKQNWIVMTDLIGFGLWHRLDRITTWSIVQVWSMLKMKLNYYGRLGRVWSMKKMR